MASLCRSAASAARSAAGGGSRSSAVSLRSVFQFGTTSSSSSSSRTFSSSSSLLRRSVMASCSVMGIVELSLMPLHSAEASARLNSLIAAHSWLTQGRALPL